MLTACAAEKLAADAEEFRQVPDSKSVPAAEPFVWPVRIGQLNGETAVL